MLEFINLTKKYGDNIIVDNLNLTIEPGTILGFLGPNGAGKTTTIKMSCGLISPTKGDIKIFGNSISKDYKKYMRDVGAVLEGNRNIYWKLTPIENMEYFAAIRGVSNKNLKEDINKYLDLFNLKDKKNCECGKLSRGMQQKVAICCSMIGNSRVLFLDEPTLGLDVESVLAMEQMIKEIISNDKIIFITSHDLHFINELCERIVIINKGKLVWDNPVNNFKNYYSDIVYDVEIDNFNEKLHKKLQYKFLIKSSGENGHTILQFEIEDDNEIVNILNILKNENLNILSVNKHVKNTEEIFIDIINQNKKGDNQIEERFEEHLVNIQR